MQNKGYKEATADARLFADFIGSTIDRVEQVVRTAKAKQQNELTEISAVEETTSEYEK